MSALNTFRSFLLALVGVFPFIVHAQPLFLNVSYINDFQSGYRTASHTYRASWVREVITQAKTRPIEVTVGGLPKEIFSQTSTEDGGHCADLTITVPPQGVTAFRWSLRGRHPLTNRQYIINSVTKPLLRFNPRVGSNCIPRPLPIAVTQNEWSFSISPPTGQSAVVGPVVARYEVLFEALAGQQVLHTASEEVAIPRAVPVIVSIGDSFASGEGNPDMAGAAAQDNTLNPLWGRDCQRHTTAMMLSKGKATPRMNRRPQWFDDRDHRSLKSAPAQAARELLRDWPYIAFLSFAKSGAVITTPETDQDVLEQLAKVQEVLGETKIDLLHISVGVNDVLFSTTLNDFVLNEGIFDIGGGLNAPGVLDRFAQKLVSLRSEETGYPKISSEIARSRLNVQNVVLSEYPGSLFFTSAAESLRDSPSGSAPLFSASCGVFTQFGGYDISFAEAQNLDTMGFLLNSEIKSVAANLRWTVGDNIAKQFERHGYCARVPYYVSAEDSCQYQGDFNGMMHPNAAGTRAAALELARVFRRLLPDPFLGTQPPVVRR